MKNIKFFGSVDVAPFLTEIKNLEQTKIDLYREIPESNHPNTKGVLLIFPDLNGYHSSTATEQIDLNSILQPGFFLFKTLPALLKNVMDLVNGKHLAWAFLLNLSPNGKILPHEDLTKLPIDYKRIHVVIQSKEGNSLKTGDDEVYMKDGEVWWFNNRIMHSGKNESDINRIHLVLDIKGE